MTRADRRGSPRPVHFTIIPARPYSLSLTGARYARFPEIVDRFDGGTYRRLISGNGGAVLSVRQIGSPARARLSATLTGPAAKDPRARAAAESLIGGALGAAAEVQPFYRALETDPVLGPPIQDFPGLRIAGVPSLWEALVTAVLSQQVNLRFAYDIRRELVLAFGRRVRVDGELWLDFPRPGRLLRNAAHLRRGFRLSRAKSDTLVRSAEAFASGAISQEELGGLTDEAAIERLTSLRGIGRWTAEIALLRGMGREDVFPAADLGVVKYLATELLGRRAPAREREMRELADRWRPWRGLALVYAYAELQRRREARSAAGVSVRRSPRSRPASALRPRGGDRRTQRTR